jgi:hypothetical protein
MTLLNMSCWHNMMMALIALATEFFQTHGTYCSAAHNNSLFSPTDDAPQLRSGVPPGH